MVHVEALPGNGRRSLRNARCGHLQAMIVVGIVLLVLGLILAVPILWTLGIIVLVVGLIMLLLGSLGREVGGRRHYW